MKQLKKGIVTAGAALLSLGFVLAMVGCGADNPPAVEDAAKTKARVETVTQIRSYFDKCAGNYDALSSEDKAKVNELMGGEKNARLGFGQMGNASRGAPGGGSSTPPAPKAGAS